VRDFNKKVEESQRGRMARRRGTSGRGKCPCKKHRHSFQGEGTGGKGGGNTQLRGVFIKKVHFWEGKRLCVPLH